jgi:hypothetical protein
MSDGLYDSAPPGATTTLMLFELLEADGLAAAEELDGEDGGGAPYWALTIIGRSAAVKARENFMVVSYRTDS